jgi:choline dehydrogenase-like flavoprotein
MLIDAQQLESGSVLEADLCLIGAGAAGIAIAREFRDGPRDVILLESGGFEPAGATQALYAGETGGVLAEDPLYPVTTRLRFFGGTTNHWNGWCRPLDPQDFERRDWVPLSGWPLAPPDLTEAYAKACELCQITRFAPQEPQFSEWWRPPLGFAASSGSIETKLFFFSPPTRFGELYRDELIRSQAVRVLLHGNATQLDVASDGRRIDSIQAATLSGRRFRIKARFHVLCTGGLENPRLLLNSDGFFPKGVGNQHDLVGRTFMEHPKVSAGHVLLWQNRDLMRLYTKRRHSDHHGHRTRGVLATSERFQRRKRMLNYCVELDDQDLPARAAATVGSIAEASRGLDRRFEDRVRLDHDNRFGPLARLRSPCFARLILHGEQAPNPASRVSLIPERDALGLRQIKLDWRLTKQDYASLYESTRELARALMAGFRGRVRLDVDPDRPETFQIEYQYHHMGTTRMSEDPRSGVVDADCRVHGLSNLYVAGSSVFPGAGFANPTLTLVALAWRLAGHLKERLA